MVVPIFYVIVEENHVLFTCIWNQVLNCATVSRSSCKSLAAVLTWSLWQLLPGHSAAVPRWVTRQLPRCLALVYRTLFSRPLQCNVLLLSWDVICLSVVCNTRVLWPNGFMDQDATWYAGRPRPWPHYVRWGPRLLRLTSYFWLSDICEKQYCIKVVEQLCVACYWWCVTIRVLLRWPWCS